MQERGFIVTELRNCPEELTAFREEYIHHPGKVIPTHITLTELPLDSGLIEDVLDRLTTLCRKIEPFDYELVCLSAFLRPHCIWLAPSPIAPFESLYDHLRTEFDLQHPWPYPTFHMTVSIGSSQEEMFLADKVFCNRFAGLLPWHQRADTISLWLERNGTFVRHSLHKLEG